MEEKRKRIVNKGQRSGSGRRKRRRRREMRRTLVEAALEVFNEGDPVVKAQLGEEIANQWVQGQIPMPYCFSDSQTVEHQVQKQVPDRPARLPIVKLVPSHLMPKLGKGGSLHSRQAILHSLVHTESWAIDLSWDIIARFGTKQHSMPTQFFTDFVRVAQDEGRHFTLLFARLRQLGSFYGAFPAHDGLWDSAIRTSNSLLARLAIEHCVHEARGLDVLPSTISRFRSGGDECTANLLETVVYPEEITHCAAGVKWFKFLCLRKLDEHPNAARIPGFLSSENPVIGEGLLKQLPATREEAVGCQEPKEESCGNDERMLVIPTFHDTVRRYFRGPLKPPFNKAARKAARFAPEWYEPLAVKEQNNAE